MGQDKDSQVNSEQNFIYLNKAPAKFRAHLSSNEAFELAKKEGISPQEKAEQLIKEIKQQKNHLFSEVKAVGGFINYTLSPSGFSVGLQEALPLKSDKWKGETVVVDYSGPNVGKPFSVGHLRSTVIGDAVANMYQALGAKVIRVNHLGDFGTQFGKLIVALKKWGDEGIIAANPTEELLKLYVKFHEEVEKEPELNDEARAWYKKLEDQDKEAVEIWKKIVDWSLIEYHTMYELLRVEFESDEVSESGVLGESFYTKEMMMEIMIELEQKKLVKDSEGAKILDLGEDIPETILIKKDGTTVYLLRDLAALKYRLEKWKARKVIYHVGVEQSLHLKQLFTAAKKLGWLNGVVLLAAHHGHYRLADGKMSTRAGRGVKLKDLVERGISEAKKLVNDPKKAQSIAVSAIKYNDLSHNRAQDIIFEWGKALNLEGNSAPYLVYTNARAHGVFRQSKYLSVEKFKEDFTLATPLLKEKKEEELMLEIILCRKIINIATFNAEPNLLAEKLYQIARLFNSYYGETKINTEDKDLSDARLTLTKMVSSVLEEGLAYLGIQTFEEL